MTGSPGTALRELSAAALIGADRAGGGGADGARPQDILSRAGAWGTRQRAGLKPRTVAAMIPACPAESRPQASKAQLSTLARLLGDPDAALIAEWCELAERRGVRVSQAVVPQVLDWWARQPRRADVVFAVLGKRAEWLAALNPAWRKPVVAAEVPANADELWQTGTAAERAALLLSIRRHDAARGLALVQSTWASDGAEERRRFIEAMKEHGSMADEPFLEAALDDKSKLVRGEAAAALGVIKGSRLLARMNERARGVLSVEAKRGLIRKSIKIALVPPAEFDKAWERDGLAEPAPGGKGKRAWWLRQIMEAAELSVWTEASGLDPAGVLEALEKDDYFKDALEAFTRAAERSADAAASGWTGALAAAHLARDKFELGPLLGLVRAVPGPQREELLLELVGHKRLEASDRWFVLAAADEAWSGAFSAKALAILKKNPPAKGQLAWTLHEPVQMASRLVAPSAADAFEAAVTAMFPDEPTESFKKSIDRVRLRADMHKEFAT